MTFGDTPQPNGAVVGRVKRVGWILVISALSSACFGPVCDNRAGECPGNTGQGGSSGLTATGGSDLGSTGHSVGGSIGGINTGAGASTAATGVTNGGFSSTTGHPPTAAGASGTTGTGATAGGDSTTGGSIGNPPAACPAPSEPPTVATLAAQMVGIWTGWSSASYHPAPNAISATFEADGHYSARVTTALPGYVPMAAFCTGDDLDDPRKTYEVDTLWGNNEGTGLITFTWDATSHAGASGTIDHIRTCADGNQLDFQTSGGPGVGSSCMVTLVRTAP